MKALTLLAVVLGLCFEAHRLVNPDPAMAFNAIETGDMQAAARCLDHGTSCDACNHLGQSLAAVAAGRGTGRCCHCCWIAAPTPMCAIRKDAHHFMWPQWPAIWRLRSC